MLRRLSVHLLMGLICTFSPGLVTRAANADPGTADSQPASAQQLLEVRMNGRALGVAEARRDSDGQWWLPSARLAEWGLSGLKTIEQGMSRLEAPIAARFDGAAQMLELEVPAELLPMQRITVRAAAPPLSTETVPAVFLNYSLQAQRLAHAAQERTRLNALTEASTTLGGGLLTHVQSLQWAGGQHSTTRLDTSWTRDSADRRHRLVLGDGISAAGQWGRSVRFGGLRWGTDTTLRPDLVNFATPTLRGSAAVPSTVDVLINGTPVLSRDVDAGPFEIGTLPMVSGQGTLTMRVRDALGRQQTISQPLFVSTTLLPTGVSQYSVAAGWLRSRYMIDSNRYDLPMAQAQYRHGLTEAATIETRAEASSRHLAAGVGGGTRLGAHTLMHAALAGSAAGHATAGSDPPSDPLPDDGADRRTGGSRRGGLAQLAIEQLGRTWRWSASHALSSPGFVQLGDSRLQFPDLVPMARRREQTQFFVGLTLGGHSIGASILMRRDEFNSDRLVTLSHSMRIGERLILSSFANQSRSNGVTAGINLVWVLDPRHSSVLNSMRNSDGRSQTDAIWQRAMAPGQSPGYTLRVADQNRLLAASVVQQSPTVFTMVDVAHDQQSGLATRAYATGRLLLAERSVVPLNQSGDSVALVTLEGFPGVRVRLENREAGVTNAQGRVWVTGLRPYQVNRLAVATDDLPIDADVQAAEFELTPRPRTVVRGRPLISGKHPLQIRLLLPGGTPIPPEALVYRSDDTQVPTGAAGEILLRVPVPGEVLEARWPGKVCHTTVPAGILPVARPEDWAPLACVPRDPVPAPASPRRPLQSASLGVPS